MDFDPHKPFTGPDGRRYACAADYLVGKPAPRAASKELRAWEIYQSDDFASLSRDQVLAWADARITAFSRSSYFTQIDDLLVKAP